MIGSLECKNLIQHVKVRSLTCHHRFLNMSAPVPPWHDRLLEMSSSVPSYHETFHHIPSSAPSCRHQFHHLNISFFASWRVAQTPYFSRSHFLQVAILFLFLESVLVFLDATVDVVFYLQQFWDCDQGISFECAEWMRDLTSSSGACHPLFLNM